MKRLVEIDDATHVVAPREATDEMLNAPSTVIQKYGARLIYERMLAAAPPLCETCGDVGMIGGHRGQTPESYEEHGEPCPDCNAPTLPDAQAVTDERTAFEAWFEREIKAKSIGGNLLFVAQEMMRSAWEARAALSVAAGDDKRDAERYRWITEDHADLETRYRCREILTRMRVMSYSAACQAIDVAIAAASKGDGHE